MDRESPPPESDAYASVLGAAGTIAARLQPRWTASERDDLVQEVMIKYLRTWTEGARPDNVDAWLTTVIKNTAITMNEARQRREDPMVAAAKQDSSDPVDLLFALASPMLTSLQAVSEQLIEEFLALVPEQEREILTRKYLHRRSSSEIAEELGLSVNAVDQRARRAKLLLQKAAAERPDLVDELRRPHPRLY